MQKAVLDCATGVGAILPMSAPEIEQRETLTASSEARYAAIEATAASAAQLRSQIINIAQSAVGVSVDQLTAGQVRALAAILLNKAHGLREDLTVAPLSEWA